MRRAAVAAAILALVACSGERMGETGADLSAPTDRPTPAPSAAPSESPSESPGPQVAACAEEDVAAIDEVVGQQLAAFRQGDFRGALQLATEGFRSRFTAERFEQVMTEGFPAVVESRRHVVEQCVGSQDQALALVQVSGTAGSAQLVYDLRREGGRWRINGAQPHGGEVAPSETELTV